MKIGWRQKRGNYRYKHRCPKCGRIFYCNGYHKHIYYTTERLTTQKHECTLMPASGIGDCCCPEHNDGFECDVVYEEGMEPEE